MKLSERLYKTADDFDKSESIWERRMPWRKLADEVAQLEAHVEELDGYWQFEIAQRNKAEAKNERYSAALYDALYPHEDFAFNSGKFEDVVLWHDDGTATVDALKESG